MANNYLQFSEVISHLNTEERIWLKEQLESEEDLGFKYEFDDDHEYSQHLWVYAEGWGDLEQLANLTQRFLKQFRPDDLWTLTYAVTCSKPRLGEFGGGVVIIEADEIEWLDAQSIAEDRKN